MQLLIYIHIPETDTASRKFKRSRIEWDYDECDAPLPQPPIVTYQPEPLIKKPLNPMANRFELLSFDDDDY